MSRGRQPSDLSALSDLAPELAEMLVSVACDIAFVLDEGGVIRTVAVGGGEPVADEACGWVGQRWTETFTGDTRPKAEEVLNDLAASGTSRLRHLNHASIAGSDIPVAYTAVRLGEQGPTLAVGRDMRVVAAMQERLLQAQHDIERDHWKRRQIEARYRLLFQFATEAALILDGITFEVIDANQAASEFWGFAPNEMIGKPVTDLVEQTERALLCELLARTRMSQRVIAGTTRSFSSGENVEVTATAFDIGSTSVLVLRAHPPRAPFQAAQERAADAVLAELVKRSPDAVVVSDESGRVSLTNRAFRELVLQTTDEAVVGRLLSDWFANDGALEAVLAEVRGSGSVSVARAQVRRGGALIEVELSASRIFGDSSIGLIIRVARSPELKATSCDDGAGGKVH